MAITRDMLVEQQTELTKQRDQALDALRQMVGALQVIDYLIKQCDADAKPSGTEFRDEAPAVGANSTLHTEADVPQAGA